MVCLSAVLTVFEHGFAGNDIVLQGKIQVIQKSSLSTSPL